MWVKDKMLVINIFSFSLNPSFSFRVKFQHSNILPFTKQCQVLTSLAEKAYKNIMGKGENASNQHFLLSQNVLHFLLSHNVFYPSNSNVNFLASLILLSANALNLDLSKILSFGERVCR